MADQVETVDYENKRMKRRLQPATEGSPFPVSPFARFSTSPFPRFRLIPPRPWLMSY
jgi:hypothetical protein